jgi:hypothetical protein
MICPDVYLAVKPVGEPYAVAPHVRFDERGWETGRCRLAQATAPILDSTFSEVAPVAFSVRLRFDCVAKLVGGQFGATIESETRMQRIEVALRHSATNQCCAIEPAKYFCNTIDP